MRRGLGFCFLLDDLRTNRGTKAAPSSVFLVLSVVPAKNLRTLALKLSMSQPISGYLCIYLINYLLNVSHRLTSSGILFFFRWFSAEMASQWLEQMKMICFSGGRDPQIADVPRVKAETRQILKVVTTKDIGEIQVEAWVLVVLIVWSCPQGKEADQP